jgi:hypothetical protein
VGTVKGNSCADRMFRSPRSRGAWEIFFKVLFLLTVADRQIRGSTKGNAEVGATITCGMNCGSTDLAGNTLNNNGNKDQQMLQKAVTKMFKQWPTT